MIGWLRGKRIARYLVLGGAAIAIFASVTGAGTFVALEVTTKPRFCASCHIMEPYVHSWETSSHSHVPCVDCHYEPGLLETFEGKFKALSQLAKYVTATEGTKPWAEVSDRSCMRSGCHSTRLLEGEIQFGRIRFDHRHHLIGMQAGITLRCTSCHSQIVQGDHVSVTPTTCVLCHFSEANRASNLGDCYVCHGPPQDEIHLGSFIFRHSAYLDRGVECASCHGDVTRGTGEVPRDRCGNCHNKVEHLERYEEVDFLHQHHVKEHSVSCLACHTAMEHGLPPRQEHYRGDCSDCHTGTHSVSADVYRGTGGRGVADDPGIMYLARVTCRGCHRPPFADAPAGLEGATWAADPLACLDCHGVEYEGMVERWQEETRASLAEAQAAVEALTRARQKAPPDRAEAARSHHDAASYNLALVLLDRSAGVHNLPYVRSLLRQVANDVAAGFEALGAEGGSPRVRVGPFAPSEWQCTNLCHVGIETNPLAVAFGDRPFPHAKHVLEAGLDCSACHAAEPHGTTTVRPADCASCHHERADDEEQCATCHEAVYELRRAEADGVEPSPMQDLDCLACHESIADGHDLEAVQATCDECHEDDDEDFSAKHYAAWIAEAEAPLRELEAAFGSAPKARAEAIRREIEALRRAGPFHNPAWVRHMAERWRRALEEGEDR